MKRSTRLDTLYVYMFVTACPDAELGVYCPIIAGKRNDMFVTACPDAARGLFPPSLLVEETTVGDRTRVSESPILYTWIKTIIRRPSH